MLPLIDKEFRLKRTSLVVYCVIVVMMVVLYTSIFPTIQAQSQKLTELINSLGSVYKALGVENAVMFDTLEHYMSVELFGITWPIMAVAFVTAQAGSAIAGEIEQSTIGMVMSLPVRRLKIYLSKFLAGVISLLIYVTLSVFTILPVAALSGVHFRVSHYFTMALLCLLFGWAVYSLGLMLSAVMSEKGHVYGAVGGLMALMYVANAIAGLKPSFDWLKYASFFHYFNAGDALGASHIALQSFGVFGGVILVSTAIGLAWFSRRDVII